MDVINQRLSIEMKQFGFYDKALTWAEIYDTCSIEGKKMIIRQLIKKISMFKDYSLKIELNLSYKQFAELLSNPDKTAKITA